MMRQPGFIESLRRDISHNSNSIRNMVDRPGGLRDEEFFSLLCDPHGNELQAVINPNDTNVSFYHDDLDGYRDLGSQHEFVHCIYAGEVDTVSGNPKALMRVPGLGISLLAIKLLQTPKGCRTLIVAAPHQLEQIKSHVAMLSGPSLDDIQFVEQDSVYMLSPDYRLIKDEFVSCGSGGVVAGLLRSDHLKILVDANVKYIYVTDVSNVLATPSLEILGHHIKHGSKITFEVVRRDPEKFKTVLVESEFGVNLVDPVRLNGIELSDYCWGGTGSVILSTDLELARARPPWRRVRRVHKNYLSVRYERFLEELSEAYTSSYVGIARDERFFWIDSIRDLEEISKRVTIRFAG